MKRRKERDWLSLDNAAKIFPSTSTERASNVFRFACELTEPVDPQLLEEALEQTLERFPFFRVVLKRGFFWYYLEMSDIKAKVGLESRIPCSRIYYKDRRDLLFDVTYYESRINFEVFHALTDGTGALQFLRTLVWLYLTAKHRADLPASIPPLLLDASHVQKQEDSFQKYYDPKKRVREKGSKAYRLKGAKLSEDRISIIEGVVPAGDVLKLAREIGVTMTEYLSAALLLAIRKEIPIREQNRPLALSIPVNLRKYFDSGSARNFFGLISADYDLGKAPGTVEDLAKYLKESFSEQLTAENLIRRMSRLTAIEKHPVIRSVPLFLKDIVMKYAKDLDMDKYTCTLSNVGVVSMPEYLHPYIERFSVFNSTSTLQVCICTYRDKLSITFTSSFISSEIEKNFFRSLSAKGVPIDILSNAV